jgi:hypothetical protein
MEVFSTNTDSLKKELEIVKEELIHAKRNRFRDVYYLLRALYSILYNVSSEIDEEAADLILENQEYVENYTVNSYKKISNKYLENFLENKDFHKTLSDRIIDVYRKKKFDLDYKYEINLSDKEMTDIMLSFLNDEFGNADKFVKLRDEGKIFKVDASKELNVGGYNLFKAAIPMVDVMYITDINMVIENGDVFFPEFDESKFNITIGEETPEYTRKIYRRKQ